MEYFCIWEQGVKLQVLFLNVDMSFSLQNKRVHRVLGDESTGQCCWKESEPRSMRCATVTQVGSSRVLWAPLLKCHFLCLLLRYWSSWAKETFSAPDQNYALLSSFHPDGACSLKTSKAFYMCFSFNFIRLLNFTWSLFKCYPGLYHEVGWSF